MTTLQSITETINSVKNLVDRFDNLRTFDSVKEWDSEAQNYREILISAVSSAESDLAAVTRSLETHLSSLSIGQKLLPNKKANELKQHISILEKVVAGCEPIVQELQSRLDRSPNNKDEQQRLLNELKLQRKELQLEKREANAEMRGVREHAGTKSAMAGGGISYLMGLTAAQRRIIRLNKEAALHPYRSRRDLLENQILILDREILWVESIS